MFSDHPPHESGWGPPFGLWQLSGLFPSRSCFAENLLSLCSPAGHQWSNRVFHLCCHEQGTGRQVGNLKDTPLFMAFLSFHSGPVLTEGSFRGGARSLVHAFPRLSVHTHHWWRKESGLEGLLVQVCRDVHKTSSPPPLPCLLLHRVTKGRLI